MSGVKNSVALERLSFLKGFLLLLCFFPFRLFRVFTTLAWRRDNGGKAVALPAIRARPRGAGTS
jgi:hypothetical protein